MKVQKNNSRRYLGSLCVHGHEFEETGKSLRYEKCRTCCSCNALSVEKRKKKHKEYRAKNKKKMKKYQAKYRKDKTMMKFSGGRISISTAKSKYKSMDIPVEILEGKHEKGKN